MCSLMVLNVTFERNSLKLPLALVDLKQCSGAADANEEDNYLLTVVKNDDFFGIRHRYGHFQNFNHVWPLSLCYHRISP